MSSTRGHRDTRGVVRDCRLTSGGLTKLLAAAALLLVVLPDASPADQNFPGSYVGAEICAPCHQEIFEQWRETGHARIMTRPRTSETRDIPLPLGLTEDNVSRVIGGVRWKALFLDRQGFLITADGNGPGNTQFNLAGRQWVDFRPGEKVPYDCGPCHATGYSAEGHQGGLPGIVGTWSFDGVQCEACHGPGSAHAHSQLAADIAGGADSCAECHRRDSPQGIPLAGVFLAPYTEVNQLEQGGMRDLACGVCHDPHRSAASGLRKSCADCHEDVARIYGSSLMAKARVSCIDCHMPPAGLVAQGDAAAYRGDLRSHLFGIDHHEPFPQRTSGGRSYNPGAIGVAYMCTRCHGSFESQQWALAYASVVHQLKATMNTRIMAFQAAFAYAGMAFAILAMLSAAAQRGWIHPFAERATLEGIHRASGWITFAIFIFEASLCLFVHTPLSQIARLESLGWFAIHPVFGAAGLLLYIVKIFVVHRGRRGWGPAGVIAGVSLFTLWVLQLSTVVLAGLESARIP